MHHAFFLAASLTLLASPARAQLLPGWGLQQHRATQADMHQLRMDAGKLAMAERDFMNQQHDVERVLNIEKQKEVMGIEQDPNMPPAVEALAGDAREFWVKNVLQPAFDIMANPAATCELARSMLGRIVKMEHQAQIIGLAGLRFGDLGDSKSILGQAFSLARYRCLAEAFNECMATGNGQALIMAMSEWGQQIKITSPELEEAWERQVTYLFRRCTVYKLSYNMKLQDRKTRESSVVLGSFTLLFTTEGEGIVAFARGMWLPRKQELMAPDVRVMAPDCGPDITTCREKTKGGVGGAAYGIIQLRRDATEQSFEVVPFEPKPPLETRRTEGPNIITDRRLVLPDNAQNRDLLKGRAWTMLHTTRHREGKDSLFMNFGPPLTQMNAISAGTGGNVEMADANGTGLYYMANGKEMGQYPLVIDETWVRETYPKLYSAGHAASSNGVEESTTFELTHRPDLFPKEDYVESLELGPQPKAPQVPLD